MNLMKTSRRDKREIMMMKSEIKFDQQSLQQMVCNFLKFCMVIFSDDLKITLQNLRRPFISLIKLLFHMQVCERLQFRNRKNG